MNRQEKIILFYTCGAHFLTHFYILIFPALIMPISRDFNLSVSQVVNISFTMYLLYGILAVGWGFLSDRLGHKWVLAAGIIISGCGLILASIFRTSLLMSMAFTLVGIGCAAYHPAGMALISQGVNRRGKALGINGIWGSIGIASAPFAVGWFNFFLGWRTGLVIIGSIGILLGVGVSLSRIHIEKGSDKLKINTLDSRVARRLFLIFAVGIIFSGFMYRSYTLTLPSFLEYRLGNFTEIIRSAVSNRLPSFGKGDAAANASVNAFDTLVANLVATGIYLIGIVGQAVGGRTADRVSLKWAYFIFFSLAFPFALGLALLKGWLLIVAGGFFIFFSLGMQPIENSLVAFLTPARWRSVSFGIKFTLLFGIGSFAVKLVGHVESSTTIANVMWIVCFFLGLVLLNTSIFLFVSRKHSMNHSRV